MTCMTDSSGMRTLERKVNNFRLQTQIQLNKLKLTLIEKKLITEKSDSDSEVGH